MFCVHKKSCKLIAVKLKPEKHTDSHIINTALHGSVHCLGVAIVVVLGTCGVELFVTLFIVGFLKKNVCADSGFLELFIIFNGCCGNVHINPSDCAVLVIDRINGLYAVENVLNRVVYGIFACLNCKTLVSHILKCDNFFSDLILCELFTADVLVLCMIRTIDTAVYAVV